MKWNKKICIEHITQLKSPLEETMQLQGKLQGNGHKTTLGQVAERLRGILSKSRPPEE